MTTKYRLDADEIRRRASGQWDIILSQLAPEIATVLASPRKRQSCPVHGGVHGDAFRLLNDYVQTGGAVCNSCGAMHDGFALLQWLRPGWDFPTTLKNVEEIIGGGTVVIDEVRRARSLPDPGKMAFKDDKLVQQRLLDTWNASIGLGHADAEPARKYFLNRGLVPMRGPLADLRFHPQLSYWEFDSDTRKNRHVGDYPALLGMVRQPDGKPVTLHRIYLTPDGRKAPVSAPKKQMPAPSFRTLGGSAIRLDPPSEVLHLTEGIETGLAVRLIVQGLGVNNQASQGVWSSLSTSILTQVLPVSPTRLVCIWADHDTNGAGRNAADTCAAHLRDRGYRVILVLPTFALLKGDMKIDWLDVLNRFDREELANHQVMVSLDTLIAKEFQAAKAVRVAS